MDTKLPNAVQIALNTIGQVAAELPSQIEGYREFVTVFRFQTDRISGFNAQFPYLSGFPVAFRLMRFRVDAEIIQHDRDCCNEDLVGLQSIHVATEEDVQMVLRIWQISPELLREPRESAVPI